MDIDKVTVEEYARSIVRDFGQAVDDEAESDITGREYGGSEAVEDICGIVDDLRRIIARVDTEADARRQADARQFHGERIEARRRANTTW